jgi:Protein of unknown function (DUF4239)
VIEALIVIGSVAAAGFTLWLVGRVSESHGRRESNDFTGAVVAVIGTTYAVILAFLLSSLWNHFQDAKSNAELEAADVVNIFRGAQQFPGPQRRSVESLARKYAETALNVEWPKMIAGEEPHGGGSIIDQLWSVLGQSKTEGGESLATAELMSSLSSLTQHRALRIMDSTEAMPDILWVVLIAGAVVTILAACFFGVQSFRFHLLQILVLSFLISLVLVAIAAVDRPYQGSVRVEPNGFRYALRTISEESGGAVSH